MGEANRERRLRGLLQASLVDVDAVTLLGPGVESCLAGLMNRGEFATVGLEVLSALPLWDQPLALNLAKRAIQENGPKSQLEAARLLARCGDEGANELFALAKNADPDAQVLATWGLEELADGPHAYRAMELLVALANSGNPAVQRRAVDALRPFHTVFPQSINATVVLLDSQDRETRWRAVLNITDRDDLDELKQEKILNWLTSLNADFCFHAAELLYGMKDKPREAMPLLIAAIDHLQDNHHVVWRLIDALAGYGKDARHAAPLIKSIWLNTARTKGAIYIYVPDQFAFSCSSALAMMGAVSELLEGLHEKAASRSASDSIAMLRNDAAAIVPDLIRLSSDERDWLAFNAFRALCSLGSLAAPAYELIADTAKNATGQMQSRAFHALIPAGGDHGILLLAELLCSTTDTQKSISLLLALLSAGQRCRLAADTLKHWKPDDRVRWTVWYEELMGYLK